MSDYFCISETARAEALQRFGEDFTISLLGRFDVNDIYAPVCADPLTNNIYLDGARARHVWPDMLEPVG